MPRLVDVEALKLPDEYQIGPFDGPYYRGIGNGWNSALQACREHIDSTPTVSPDEVRGVGKREKDSDGLDVCSECGEVALQRVFIKFPDKIVDLKMVRSKFCPNCGARLEVSVDA